jgi:DNA-binding GntR family transcriptional regulator
MTELRSALQAHIRAKLIDDLRAGRLAIGATIRTDNLAKSLGVSRTPVRQSLLALVNEGVLALQPTGAFMVASQPPPEERPSGKSGPEATLYERLLNDMVVRRLDGVVTEVSLVRRYGSSQGQVAAVLSRLAAEGLAEPVTGSRWRFAQFDREAMRQSYQLRLYLEPAIIEEMTALADETPVRLLRDEHDEAIRTLSEATSFDAAFNLDARFHEFVVGFTANGLIQEIMRRQTRLRRLSEYLGRLRLDRVRASFGEHKQILDAMLDRDFSWAAALMRRHLLTSLRQMSRHFERDLSEIAAESRAMEGRSDDA